MAFCPNCGASVEGRFCAKCGTAISGGAAPSAAQPNATPPPGASPYTAPVASAGGIPENVAGMLCYIFTFVTGILFLVLAPYNQSKFVRFHAFQSIFLSVAWFIFIVVETIVSILMPAAITILLGFLVLLIGVGVFILWIFLLIKAYQGERFKLPIIGDLAEKQAGA